MQKCPNFGWDATRSPLSKTVTCVSCSWSGNFAYSGSEIHGTGSVNGMLWILAISSPPTPVVVANCRQHGKRTDLTFIFKIHTTDNYWKCQTNCYYNITLMYYNMYHTALCEGQYVYCTQQIAHVLPWQTTAKISKVKDLALIWLISVFTL